MSSVGSFFSYVRNILKYSENTIGRQNGPEEPNLSDVNDRHLSDSGDDDDDDDKSKSERSAKSSCPLSTQSAASTSRLTPDEVLYSVSPDDGHNDARNMLS